MGAALEGDPVLWAVEYYLRKAKGAEKQAKAANTAEGKRAFLELAVHWRTLAQHGLRRDDPAN